MGARDQSASVNLGLESGAETHASGHIISIGGDEEVTGQRHVLIREQSTFHQLPGLTCALEGLLGNELSTAAFHIRAPSDLDSRLHSTLAGYTRYSNIAREVVNFPGVRVLHGLVNDGGGAVHGEMPVQPCQ